MLQRLIYDEILRVEHHDLILAFIESQIKQFDDFHKNSETYAVDMDGPVNPTTALSSGTRHLTILGSKQKASTIEELLKSTNADSAFASFCSRVSRAIQELSSNPADTPAVNDSHQVPMFVF